MDRMCGIKTMRKLQYFMLFLFDTGSMKYNNDDKWYDLESIIKSTDHLFVLMKRDKTIIKLVKDSKIKR